MTEAEWLAAVKPEPMIRHLAGDEEWRNSLTALRKVRLFGAACVRRIWSYLAHADLRASVELYERHPEISHESAEAVDAWRRAVAALRPLRPVHPAPEGRRFHEVAMAAMSGHATQQEVQAAREAAHASLASIQEWPRHNYRDYYSAKAALYSRSGAEAASNAAQAAGYAKGGPADGTEMSPPTLIEEWATQAEVCREVFGNPFRRAVILPGVKAATSLSVAHAAYEERALPSGHLDVRRLAVLADSLEEAGCTDEAILSHLRSPGPHVRGCWALDLVLGKA